MDAVRRSLAVLSLFSAYPGEILLGHRLST